ncbi:Chromatin remodeling [Thalictrum thalictroides]|uniref:Chromatin remodeling n=1 Tax=Thalictrum thalictroides TaxID=46969 RepID=A0A7J6V184_THATH|nr:Chromatin remodeling [Thalictrum thalictroides]
MVFTAEASAGKALTSAEVLARIRGTQEIAVEAGLEHQFDLAFSSSNRGQPSYCMQPGVLIRHICTFIQQHDGNTTSTRIVEHFKSAGWPLFKNLLKEIATRESSLTGCLWVLKPEFHKQEGNPSENKPEMEKSILVSLILVCLLFIYTIFARPLPLLSPVTVLDAVHSLSDSGYLAMSLVVKAECKNAVFQASGQPPVSLLRFHFSPLKLTMKKLKLLPFGTRIPTLFDDKELILTSTPLDDDVSINNVTINGSPIYNVGTMVVYGINKFFDPSYENSQISNPVVRNPIKNLST